MKANRKVINTGFYFIATLIFTIYSSELKAQTQLGEFIYGENEGGRFGWSISLSDNGERMAVGAITIKEYDQPGRVKVFDLIDGEWSLVGSELVGEFEKDFFGTVSLSPDGDRMAVGASAYDEIGYVGVYEYIDGDWNLMGNNIHGEEFNGRFGTSVSLSSDGSRVAVGARRHGQSNIGNAVYAFGQVRIFDFQGNDWVQIGQAIDGEIFGEQAGSAVALSSSGERVAIGSWLGGSNSQGHVQIFELQGSVWVQIGQSISGDEYLSSFGTNLSFSLNGSRIAIGAIRHDGNLDSRGLVRVLDFDGNNWIQTGQDILGENEDDQLGPVSLSSDGNYLGVGAYGAEGKKGYGKLYGLSGNTWNQIGDKVEGRNQGDYSGFSVAVAVNPESAILALGAVYSDEGQVDAGYVHAYSYLLNPTFTFEVNQQENTIVYPNPTIGKLEIDNGSILKLTNIQGIEIGYDYVSKNEIDISHLQTGLYYLHIESNNKTFVKKIFKL